MRVSILYAGTNAYGNKIIGSFLDDDPEKMKIYSLHSIVTNKVYTEFINSSITYLDLLKVSHIYLFEQDYNNTCTKAYRIDFQSLPQKYHPTEFSYCPEYILSLSHQYSVLLGKSGRFKQSISKKSC